MFGIREKNKNKIPVSIRWLMRKDMPQVLAIENESFEFPWPEEDFIIHLKQKNGRGIVAVFEDRIIGFMIYEFNKIQIQVNNLAVAKAYRRAGIGTQMVAELIKRLSSQERNRITLVVRETNLPAQLFFRANGFRAVSIFYNFYAETPEDAYLMEYRYHPLREKTEPIFPGRNDDLFATLK